MSIISKVEDAVLSNQKAGVSRLDDGSVVLDSLAKLNVIMYLDELKEGFLESKLSELEGVFNLITICGIYDSFIKSQP